MTSGATRPKLRSARLDRRTRAARAQGEGGRAALLDAAARVFSERGYRDASVDAIAAEAGFSKGAVYWHFAGKEDLFFALLEERIERPMRDMIELLESAPAERDMVPEANRRFVDYLEGQRDLVRLDHEYRSLAIRKPELRERYAARRAELRKALGRALEARVRHLGAPVSQAPMDRMAGAFMALSSGLALERLIDPDAVPDDLLGEIVALVYAGLLMRAGIATEAATEFIPRSP